MWMLMLCLIRPRARARPQSPPPIMAMGWVEWFLKGREGANEVLGDVEGESCEVGEVGGVELESLMMSFDCKW